MKSKVINSLGAVVNTLDGVTVSGVNNMLKITGCVKLLEDVIAALGECEITAAEKTDTDRTKE